MQAELLALERAVYGPDPDPAAVERLAVLLAALRDVPESQSADGDAPPAAEGPEPAKHDALGRQSLRPLVLPIAGFLVLCGFAAALAGTQQDPDAVKVERPSVVQSASTADPQILVAYSRLSQPGTTPTTVTYQPNGYALVDPKGAALRAELTCTGVGTVDVILTDGTRFLFRCGKTQIDELSEFSAGAHTRPFLVIARTTGDVVWDLTISAVRNEWRADLD